MKTFGYRIPAPRRPRAGARAQLRSTSIPDWLLWLTAAMMMAIGLILVGATTARSQSAAVSAAPSTSEYVQQSALTDIFAVNASRLALQKTQDPEIRDFAQQMINDRGEAPAELGDAVKSGKAGVRVPASLDARREQDLNALEAKSGAAFDHAYLQTLLQGHRNALDLQRAYAQSGDNDALKRLAGEITPVVQRHLSRLELLMQLSFIACMC